MSKAHILDSTLQKTHIWLRDVESRLGFENDVAALAALRSTLHAVRDRLPTDLVAHLGAQLPTLLRGVYYEGWDPAPAFGDGRSREDFLESVRRNVQDHRELTDPERTARAALAAVTDHITAGETAKIVHALPRDARALWPSPAGRDAG